MSAEKIIISFDDEEAKEEPVINIEEKELGVKSIVPEKININNFSPCGDSGLSNFFECDMPFPSGTESGFSKKFNKELKDTFLSPVLAFRDKLLVTSVSGNIFLINYETGETENRFSLKTERFETAGIVFNSKAYLHSLKKLYVIDGENIEEVYTSDSDYFFWSNSVTINEKVYTLLYSVTQKAVKLISYDTVGKSILFHYECSAGNLNNSLIASAGKLIFYANNSFVFFDINLNKGKEVSIPGVLIFIDTLGNIYYTTENDEVNVLNYSGNTFTGIKIDNINSISGFGTNLFIGSILGWSVFKSNGIPVYQHNEITESKIEGVSENILAVSMKNKIVFHNVNMYAEAEGFGISKSDSDYIISVIFTKNRIFVLSKEGILVSFSNDRININI